MKKLYYVFFLLSVIAFSCSKDNLLNSGQDPNQKLSNVSLKSKKLEITVSPNSIDDTQALIDAFTQASALGKAAVVRLMPGTFKIGMIEVREFNGALIGSGKGNTIITNLPGLTPDAVIQASKLPALITFIGGDVLVSDLSIQLSEDLPWVGTYEMNMLLFSDYSADFVPKIKHIKVNLNNIDMTGILHINDSYEFSYDLLRRWLDGVKFAPDIRLTGNILQPRSNIDVTIINSKFSRFNGGVYVWGCKSGNINIGTEGGNIFTENFQGLAINENIGVKVKIENNVFDAMDFCFDGLDINTSDNTIDGVQYLETADEKVGTYQIKDNIFNVYLSDLHGVGLWDDWRFRHPNNPDWMEMTWESNTFNDLDGGATVLWMDGLKNAVFSENKFVGPSQGGHLKIDGSWLAADDPAYAEKWLENCTFKNNIFTEKDFIITLNPTTKDCVIKGDLGNASVIDNGINNLILGNPK
jgi:hypothetical protein